MRPGVLPALALVCLLGANAESGEVLAGASAFAGPQAQAEERVPGTIVMTIQAAELRDAEATIRVSRRDTINGSIVSSFPQTFTLARAREGWTILEIGSR